MLARSIVLNNSHCNAFSTFQLRMGRIGNIVLADTF